MPERNRRHVVNLFASCQSQGNLSETFRRDPMSAREGATIDILGSCVSPFIAK